MKPYNEIQKISLEACVSEKAWKFAQEVAPTTNYSDGGQHLLDKIRMDHYISKLGEEAAREVFKRYCVVEGPDYTLYEKSKKSWDDDLKIGGVGMAVKTQSRTAAIKYGLSWMFQDGQYKKDTILNKPESWVVFTVFDDKNPFNVYVYPPYQIKELTFAPPKLEHLKGSKKVVYVDTLKLEK